MGGWSVARKGSSPRSTVARELGIQESTLGRWVHDFRARAAAGEAGQGGLSETERAELLRLRKENSDLKLDRHGVSFHRAATWDIGRIRQLDPAGGSAPGRVIFDGLVAPATDSSTPRSTASRSRRRTTTLTLEPSCNDAAIPATRKPNPSARSSGDCPTWSSAPSSPTPNRSPSPTS